MMCRDATGSPLFSSRPLADIVISVLLLAVITLLRIDTSGGGVKFGALFH